MPTFLSDTDGFLRYRIRENYVIVVEVDDVDEDGSPIVKATLGGEVVGVVHYRSGIINWMFVEQFWRRFGINSAMLDALLRRGYPIRAFSTFSDLGAKFDSTRFVT